MSDTIKAPDRSTCGYRGSGTLGSDYTLCFRRALPPRYCGLLSADLKRDDTETDECKPQTL